MTANNIGSFSSEKRLSEEASLVRQAELRSVEAALFAARLGAESMDNPVLAYFIDMAIAEVRNITPVDKETPQLQDGSKLSNVVRFVNSSAKFALQAR